MNNFWHCAKLNTTQTICNVKRFKSVLNNWKTKHDDPPKVLQTLQEYIQVLFLQEINQMFCRFEWMIGGTSALSIN